MTSDAELADRLTAKRARMLPVLAILFLSQQAIYFSDDPGAPERVAHFKIGAWVVMAVVLLLGLATGGALFRSRAVRALMNDETTRLHRLRACATGFWVAMMCGVALFLLGQVTPVTGREATHIIVSAGVAAALLSFGMQERRALR